MSTQSLENPTVYRPRMFILLSLTIALADADDPIDSDRGEVHRGKNQQSARGGSREGLKSASSEPGRSEVASGRVGPTDSHIEPKPHVEALEHGGNISPRVGESNGM